MDKSSDIIEAKLKEKINDILYQLKLKALICKGL